MGDMADDFKAFKEDADKRKEKNSRTLLELLHEHAIPFRDVGNNTILIREPSLSMDIYISKNKWKYEGRFIQGDAVGCINFIKKRLEG